jgi:ATP-binding cassette subfamily F protein uup
VSHDRAFLDNVVTSTLVLEGDGVVGEYVGGYTDWVRQRRRDDVPKAAGPAPARKAQPQGARAPKKRRLSIKEAEELAAQPEKIDALEREREALYLRLADPALLRDGAATARARARLTELDSGIAAATARWEALEAITSG